MVSRLRPRTGVAIVLLASTLSGCAVLDAIGGEDCGLLQHLEASGPPFMNTYSAPNGTAYQVYVSAEQACHKEHITYTATALVQDEGDHPPCPEGVEVIAKERPGAGAANVPVPNTDVGGGTFRFERHGDFGLAQFGRTERFTIYLDVIVPGGPECAARVRGIDLSAEYHLPKE